MTLNTSLYNMLKFFAQILLPALGTLYFTIAGIWMLPASEQVVGTIVVVDTFLGGLLSLSTSSYKKSPTRFDGTMDVAHIEDGKKTFTLSLNGAPQDLQNKQEIVFQVNDPGPPPSPPASPEPIV